MWVSLFDIFKVGIGPSSSHTIGPMIAAERFISELEQQALDNFSEINVTLYGSLAFTGKGHATDRAIILGLLGLQPDTLNPDLIDDYEQQVFHEKNIQNGRLPKFKFDPKTNIVFDYGPALPGHPNGMRCTALSIDGTLLFEKCYYSIGGGFVADDQELENKKDATDEGDQQSVYPYKFRSAAGMLNDGKKGQVSISEMMRANELIHHDEKTLDAKIDHIWLKMNASIERGMRTQGELPGGLKVKRRAKHLYDQLHEERFSNMAPDHAVNEWLSLFAMAVNEENAAGQQIVTAPTNGAAGVVPAVLRYYVDFCHGSDQHGLRVFLLTAAAIGALIKHNASISGAEMGCQGEVGSASAMAAAGLCAALGGSNEQVENAAEIALEHHLGMTCDPVKGLVQVPCIERNGLGAVKAVTAATLALRGDGTHFMPLDNCIETMRQTGLDMSNKYKETSLGGLAVNLPEC